ncbi:hypothetical protein [Streptomyces collinus]
MQVGVRSAGFRQERALQVAGGAVDQLVGAGVADVGGGAFGEEGEPFGLGPGEGPAPPGRDQDAVLVGSAGQGAQDGVAGAGGRSGWRW